MTNSQINCNVHSCRHNDQVKYCTLNDILVGCSGSEAHSKAETECVSFEKM